MTFDGVAAAEQNCPVQSLPLAVARPSKVRQRRGAGFSMPPVRLVMLRRFPAAASAIGFLNAVPDRDGTMRHVPLVIECGSRYYSSLALTAVNLYRHVSAMRLVIDSPGSETIAPRWPTDFSLEEKSALRLRFRGTGRQLPYISADDVMSARPSEDLLRGRIAIVGGSALGMQNPVLTALDPMFPDVEVQATAIDNLLQGDSFYRPGAARFWELALALLVSMISVFLLKALRILGGTLAHSRPCCRGFSRPAPWALSSSWNAASRRYLPWPS